MEIVHVEKEGYFTYMRNFHLRDKFISLKAKGLLSLMFSLPPEWDCTISGLSCISKEGVSAIRATIKELEDAGYITRERIRNESGQLKDMRYILHESPKDRDPKQPPAPSPGRSASRSPISHRSVSEKPALENPTLAYPVQETPEEGIPPREIPAEEKSTQLNTDRLNKDQRIKDPSITHSSTTGARGQSPRHQKADQIDGKEVGETHRTKRLASISELEQKVREQIEYDCLVTDTNRAELDEIVSIIAEVLATGGENFVIGGQVKPADLVMKNFLALNSGHIEYMFSCFRQARSDVRNIRQYLRASLYNAPMTIHSCTAAEIRRDFDLSSHHNQSGYHSFS